MNTQQTLWTRRTIASCSLTMNLRASIRYQYAQLVKQNRATAQDAFRVILAENYLIRRLHRIYN